MQIGPRHAPVVFARLGAFVAPGAAIGPPVSMSLAAFLDLLSYGQPSDGAGIGDCGHARIVALDMALATAADREDEGDEGDRVAHSAVYAIADATLPVGQSPGVASVHGGSMTRWILALVLVGCAPSTPRAERDAGPPRDAAPSWYECTGCTVPCLLPDVQCVGAAGVDCSGCIALCERPTGPTAPERAECATGCTLEGDCFPPGFYFVECGGNDVSGEGRCFRRAS